MSLLGRWRPTLILAALVATYLATVTADPSWWMVFGVQPAALEKLSPRFSHAPLHLDWWAVVAASDAHQAGLDPLRDNPFDPLRRRHVYSRWWYGLGYLGLRSADAPWSGWALVVAFLAVAVVRAGAHQPAGLLLAALLLLSPACMLAVERANNDLVIFLLLAGIRPLLGWGGTAGTAAAGLLVALATGLKFYPAVLFGLFPALRRGRLGWLILAAGLAGTGLFLGWYRADLALLTRTMPKPLGPYAFGGPEFFRLLDWSWDASRAATLAVFTAVAAAWTLGRARAWRAPTRDLDPVEIDFLVGAVTVLGCYAIHTGYLYRLVFLVFCLPWLTREWIRPTAWRRSWMLTAVLLILLVLAWIELPILHGWEAGFGIFPRLTRPDLLRLYLVRGWLGWIPMIFLCACVLDLLGPRLWPAAGRSRPPPGTPPAGPADPAAGSIGPTCIRACRAGPRDSN